MLFYTRAWHGSSRPELLLTCGGITRLMQSATSFSRPEFRSLNSKELPHIRLRVCSESVVRASGDLDIRGIRTYNFGSSFSVVEMNTNMVRGPLATITPDPVFIIAKKTSPVFRSFPPRALCCTAAYFPSFSLFEAPCTVVLSLSWPPPRRRPWPTPTLFLPGSNPPATGSSGSSLTMRPTR